MPFSKDFFRAVRRGYFTLTSFFSPTRARVGLLAHLHILIFRREEPSLHSAGHLACPIQVVNNLNLGREEKRYDLGMNSGNRGIQKIKTYFAADLRSLRLRVLLSAGVVLR